MINVAVVHSVPDFYSGATYSLVALVKELNRSSYYHPIVYLPVKNSILEKYLNSIGIECVALNFKDYWVSTLSENKLKYCIKKVLGPLNTILWFNTIKKSLKDHQIKLVHVNMLTCGGIGYVAERIDIPVIWHFREFMSEDIKYKFVNLRYQIQIIDKSQNIIAVSNAVKKKFQNIFNTRIDVVYNGIDFDDSELLTNKELFKEKSIRVAVVGRIFETKGQLVVLKSLEKLYQKYGLNYRLDFIGMLNQKRYVDKIKHYIDKNHANNRVSFLGQIDNVIEYLQRNTDILVVPSLKEAFGRVTVEGMLAGCIVVGSNSGGTEEILDYGRRGVLFKPNDVNDLAEKLFNISANKSHFEKIAANAKKEAEQGFSARSYASNITDVYGRVLSNWNKN